MKAYGLIATEPESRTGNHGPFLRFRLAESQLDFNARKAGEDKWKTTWYTVHYYGEPVLLSLLRKGMTVRVKGELYTRAYLSEKNQPMCSVVIFSNELEIVERRKDNPKLDMAKGAPVRTQTPAPATAPKPLPAAVTDGDGPIMFDDFPV